MNARDIPVMRGDNNNTGRIMSSDRSAAIGVAKELRGRSTSTTDSRTVCV